MCRKILPCVLYSAIFVVMLAFLPELPPFGIDVGQKEIEKIPLEGKLKPNNRLDELYEPLSIKVEGSSFGTLKGPESLVFKDGYIYTGIVGGEIVRIKINDVKNGVWQTVYRLEGKCKVQQDELIMGRPIPVEFDSKDRLLVADTYHGIYRMSKDFSSHEFLSTKPVNGKTSKHANNLAVTKDGSVYFTIYDSNFDVSTSLLGMLAEPSGRVLKYDSKTKSLTSLLDGLNNANGIILSPKEDYLLISEFGAGMIWKYYLTGDEAGLAEILLELPGMGDNINSNGKGGYFVSVVPVPFDEFHPLADLLYKYPALRRVLLRLFYSLWCLPGLINDYVYSDPLLQKMSYYFMNLETVIDYQPPILGFVIEFDANGDILQTWQSQSGKVTALSDAKFHDGYLYFGNFVNEAFGRIPYESEEMVIEK